MYTSYYSSSPIRTSASETKETNYQYETYSRQHNQSSYTKNINTPNDTSMNLRRSNDVYSQSIPSMASNPLTTPTSSRKYFNNYSASNDYNRYQTPTYTPSSQYRSYGYDNDLFRASDSRGTLNNNTRAYSYDDLRNEQNRFQSNMYNPRNTNNQYRPTVVRREQHYNYEDDDSEEIIVKSTDLPARCEQEMLQLVQAAFRRYDITNQRELAGYLKRSADGKFSPCWHCIVGRQFSSYVTHEMHGFIYFTRGPLSILLFRSGA